MASPLVSVVTPSYNHARFLPDRVQSILGQSLQDFEWIVVDDASSDQSVQVWEHLVGGDPRVHLSVHSENRGMPDTVNGAIARAQGKYIYRAESDDVCEKDFLRRLVETLEAHPPVGLAYSRTLKMDEQGKSWGGLGQGFRSRIDSGTHVFKRLISETNFIPGCSMVFRRSTLETVGPFATGPFLSSCDHHFVLRMMMHTDCAYESQPLAYHRSHGQNLSATASRDLNVTFFLRESYQLMDDVFRRVPADRTDLHELRPAAMRNISIRKATPLYLQAEAAGEAEPLAALREGMKTYDPGFLDSKAFGTACRRYACRTRFVNRGLRPLARRLLGR